MSHRTPFWTIFPLSSLIPSLLFFLWWFPYLVTLRHGCIINHAPTFGECHLSRVVDHNSSQGASLCPVIRCCCIYWNPSGNFAPFCWNTAGSRWKLKGRAYIQTCYFLASNIPLYFQKGLWCSGPDGRGRALFNEVTDFSSIWSRISNEYHFSIIIIGYIF